MESDPITSWQIEGEKVETVTDFIFLGSKSLCLVTDGHYEIKTIAPWNESDDKPRQCIKANKGP